MRKHQSQNQEANHSHMNILRIAHGLVGLSSCSDVLTVALDGMHRLYPGALFAFLEEVQHKIYCRASASYVGDEILCRAAAAIFGEDIQLLSPKGRVSPVLGAPTHQSRIGDLAICVWELPGGEAPTQATIEKIGMLVASAWRSAKEFEELRAKTSIDDLTGVCNRKGILDILRRETARAERYSRGLSVLFVDVDRFKGINDQYGHAVGDAALIGVAQQISSMLRQTDAIGRFGGDEFLVVLPDTRLKAARWVARRIEHLVRENHLQVENNAIEIGVTIGASTLGEKQATSMDDVVELADKRMLSNKRNGRLNGQERARHKAANDTPTSPLLMQGAR